VIEFPSYAAAIDCWHSPDYQAAIRIREPASTADVVIVEGYDGRSRLIGAAVRDRSDADEDRAPLRERLLEIPYDVPRPVWYGRIACSPSSRSGRRASC
jgi:hypothetical protein